MPFLPKHSNFSAYVLSVNSIYNDPEKVDEVTNWSLAKNQQELHSFLGLASYYHQFIPNFAAKCEMPPMHNKKDKTQGRPKCDYSIPMDRRASEVI